MRVHLLLFAAFREAAGQSRLDMDVAPGATAADLFDEVSRRYPSLGPLRRYTTFAVNREVSDPGTALKEGDEVAFLQPASGGAM